MEYTMLTKIGALLQDPNAVKIIEKYAPGITKNPMIGLAKGMTLTALLGVPQAKKAGLTEEMVTKLLEEINTQK